MEKAGYAPKEFAQYVGISEPTVYRLIKNGKIRTVKIGPRRILIPMGEVNRILQNGTDD